MCQQVIQIARNMENLNKAVVKSFLCKPLESGCIEIKLDFTTPSCCIAVQACYKLCEKEIWKKGRTKNTRGGVENAVLSHAKHEL